MNTFVEKIDNLMTNIERTNKIIKAIKERAIDIKSICIDEPELFGDSFDIDLACDMDFMIERCDKILHCNFLKECTWEKMW